VSDRDPDPKTDSPRVPPKLTVVPPEVEEQLDEEEREYRLLRRDLPGVKGAATAGIVSIGVSRRPPKNEFIRSLPTFNPVFAMVDTEVGMEQTYFAVHPSMIEPLNAIGISVAEHQLFLTVTPEGGLRIVPVRLADGGPTNDYAQTKMAALIQSQTKWIRIWTDLVNRCYRVYPAPLDRYPDPVFPDFSEARITRLAFKSKGRLIDTVEHPLFKQWTASRDNTE
jgi:hypothetical protein